MLLFKRLLSILLTLCLIAAVLPAAGAAPAKDRAADRLDLPGEPAYANSDAETASTTNPFEDVKKGKFYYKPVLWAVENGITNGTSATTFSPDKTCTRGQVVTFLYNTLAK